MNRSRLLVLLSCLTLLAVIAPVGVQAEETSAGEIAADGRDDVTVIAVVDGSFQPQHFDWTAARMPQHKDADLANDLPLTQGPDTWLPGFDPSAYASYNRLDLTMENTNASRSVTAMQAADAAKWNSVKQSTASAVNYYWVPDSKVVGLVRFSSTPLQQTGTSPNGAHGAGTSSVAAGNIHGTCPECVVVMVTYGGSDGEAASNWAMSQPWIDVVTNSFGYSQVERERLYSGSNTELQRQAVERGQTIFFSSGNGISNTFSVPNSTLFSSQEGPDWIITVGAVSPTGGEYSGAGKPADIASVGSGYPSQYSTATTVNSQGNFSGTSNSTPVTAGIFARSLYWARTQLDGPRQQANGVLATGTPVACGSARPDCELGDGVLTAAELRARLFGSALPTSQGINPAASADTPAKTAETELASEGHGTYFGKLKGAPAYETEFAKITGPMLGTATPPARPVGERDWMTVDSYCRQEIWGAWGGGYYVAGKTPLPAADPNWPIRTTLASTCNQLFPPL